ARDAILAADQATNTGANRAPIWTVFARHGLGFSAVGVDGTLRTGTRHDAAYDLPPDLQTRRNPMITSNPLQFQLAAGANYPYSIVASNAGSGVRYTLVNGPAGMRVDPLSGAVTWKAAFVGGRVKIQVTDDAGGKVVHAYMLPVVTPLKIGVPLDIAGNSDS